MSNNKLLNIKLPTSSLSNNPLPLAGRWRRIGMHTWHNAIKLNWLQKHYRKNIYQVFSTHYAGWVYIIRYVGLEHQCNKPGTISAIYANQTYRFDFNPVDIPKKKILKIIKDNKIKPLHEEFSRFINPNNDDSTITDYIVTSP